MRVFVKTLTGRSQEMMLARTDEGRTIKQRFHEKEDIPIDQMNLFYGMHQLADDESIERCGVRHDDTIVLVRTKHLLHFHHHLTLNGYRETHHDHADATRPSGLAILLSPPLGDSRPPELSLLTLSAAETARAESAHASCQLLTRGLAPPEGFWTAASTPRERSRRSLRRRRSQRGGSVALVLPSETIDLVIEFLNVDACRRLKACGRTWRDALRPILWQRTERARLEAEQREADAADARDAAEFARTVETLRVQAPWYDISLPKLLDDLEEKKQEVEDRNGELKIARQTEDALRQTLESTTSAFRVAQSRLAQSEAALGAARMARLPLDSRYSRAGVVPLQLHDPERDAIAHRFLESVKGHRYPNNGPRFDAPQFDIQRIDRINVPRLQKMYLAKLEDEIGLCNSRVSDALAGCSAPRVQTFQGIEMNEVMLYHGAPSHLISRLTNQGLDPRFGGSNFGCLFGFGSYFAENSSKSDIYTEPDESGLRCVLVVRVLLGEPHRATAPCREIRMPPERPDQRGPLSSVVAQTVTSRPKGCVEYPEYVIYEKAQCLPQYQIWFRHRPGCRCSHCAGRAG